MSSTSAPGIGVDMGVMKHPRKTDRSKSQDAATNVCGMSYGATGGGRAAVRAPVHVHRLWAEVRIERRASGLPGLSPTRRKPAADIRRPAARPDLGPVPAAVGRLLVAALCTIGQIRSQLTRVLTFQAQQEAQQAQWMQDMDQPDLRSITQ